MTHIEAVKRFLEEYDRVCRDPYVSTPVSFALYKVMKEAQDDEIEMDDTTSSISTPVPSTAITNSTFDVTLMRDILFRGYAKTVKQWVFGDLKHDGYGIPKCVNGYEVHPGTVSQYTGMTDKYGEKIFEGDIVNCWDERNNIEFWAVVEFGNPNCTSSSVWSLRRIRGDNHNHDILHWVEMEDTGAYCQIIGNIYQNQDLLRFK